MDKRFEVYDARQSNARDEEKRDFTKHIVRLRHRDSFNALIAGRDAGRAEFANTHTKDAWAAVARVGISAEVVLTNSHDGSSAVVLHGGLLRLACFNGLIVSDNLISAIHVSHTKRLVENVIEGAFTVAEQAPKAVEAANTWNQLQLTHDEQMVLADGARVLRFGDAEGEVTANVKPEQLLHARRQNDTGDDLWRVFNRVQENVIRGGLNDFRPAQRVEGRLKPARRMRTRPVNGIDQDVKLNKALWTLAERMAQLKTAA